MQKSSEQARAAFKIYQPVFNALGDPVRQKIMFLLAGGTQLSVAELAREIGLSRPAVSHHLKVLGGAKLVQAEHAGTRIYYRPMFQTPLAMAQDFSRILGAVVSQKSPQDPSAACKSIKRKGNNA